MSSGWANTWISAEDDVGGSEWGSTAWPSAEDSNALGATTISTAWGTTGSDNAWGTAATTWGSNADNNVDKDSGWGSNANNNADKDSGWGSNTNNNADKDPGRSAGGGSADKNSEWGSTSKHSGRASTSSNVDTSWGAADAGEIWGSTKDNNAAKGASHGNATSRSRDERPESRSKNGVGSESGDAWGSNDNNTARGAANAEPWDASENNAGRNSVLYTNSAWEHVNAESVWGSSSTGRGRGREATPVGGNNQPNECDGSGTYSDTLLSRLDDNSLNYRRMGCKWECESYTAE